MIIILQHIKLITHFFEYSAEHPHQWSDRDAERGNKLWGRRGNSGTPDKKGGPKLMQLGKEKHDCPKQCIFIENKMFVFKLDVWHKLKKRTFHVKIM